jgi:hypothetical protein
VNGCIYETTAKDTSDVGERPISVHNHLKNARFDADSMISQEESVWKMNIQANKEFTVFLVFKPNRLAQVIS